MPALRGIPAMSSRSRRRSSVFAAPTKAGVYGVSSHLPPRPICFAPNVTPVSYNESSDSSSPSTPEPLSPGSQPRLFPPSETPAPPPTRKRQPPGKRRSQGYIPRPPNAFMLFRADFVRQKHVPGSIETNHGSLSKIIGKHGFPVLLSASLHVSPREPPFSHFATKSSHYASFPSSLGTCDRFAPIYPAALFLMRHKSISDLSHRAF